MRVRASVFSFFIVFALYGIYGWVLVPLVLPHTASNHAVRPVAAAVQPDTTSEEIAPFLNLFPEDSWERNPATEVHLLRFEQTVILFEKDIIEGKHLRLQPCTVLLLPESQEWQTEEEKRRQIQQSVILRTQEYAEIEFDKDFDISKMPLPKIVNGKIMGKVTIQRYGNDPAVSSLSSSSLSQAGGFKLETEDIEISESPGLTRIETLKDVDFSFGQHRGMGAGLTLDIVQADLKQPQSKKEFNSAQFQRLKTLRLILPESLPESPDSVAKNSISSVSTLDITCRGKFVFAMNPAEQGWTTSFYQNVNLVRTNPNQTIDRLTAEEVHLTLKPTVGTNGAATNGDTESVHSSSLLGQMEPALFVARGKAGMGGQLPIPARLSVKKDQDITLIGDEIFVDLRKNLMSLSTREGADASPFVEMIVADQYRIQSERCVEYTLGQNGAFGTFVSDGKGRLTGTMGEEKERRSIELTWNEMQMEPHPLVRDQILLKLGKGITAQMSGFGKMTAEALELCFNALSAGTGMNNLTMDQAVVKNNVLFETAGGTCFVKQFHIFFTHIDEGGQVYRSRWIPQMLTNHPPLPPGSSLLSAQQPIQQVQYLTPLTVQQINAQPPALHTLTPIQTLYTPPASSSAPVASRSPLPQPVAERVSLEKQNLLGMKHSSGNNKFEITGDLMRMQVVVQNGQSSANTVALEGNVRLQEKILSGAASTGAKDRPNEAIGMTGDTVMIWNPSDLTTQIQIIGKQNDSQALLKGKGVEFFAREINLSRKDNVFWSPGAGKLVAHTAEMSLTGLPTSGMSPVNAASLNSPVVGNQLIVEWNKEMSCNGKELYFYGQANKAGNRVQTTYQTSTLWCDSMQIDLNRQVMFFDDSSLEKVQPTKIRCLENVHVKNIQQDAYGKQISVDHANVKKFYFDVADHFFSAEGPGELSSVFIGTGQGFDQSNTASVSTQQSKSGECLNSLTVWFQNEMQGVLLKHNKKIEIRGNVDAVYYPAASWEDTVAHENFTAVRKTGYMLECERLQIEEVPSPTNLSQHFMELTATNDAIIDGSGIFGKAQMIKYNQAKSMIYLEGNISFQTTTQGKLLDNVMQSIQYNIETGKVFAQTGMVVGQ